MASENLRQRSTKDEPGITTVAGGTNRNARKMAMAKRGLRSLGIAVAIPVAAAVLSSFYAGNKLPVGASTKPSWSPPLWAFHMACVSTSCLLGLSAWLMWADGGFHSRAEALPLYLAELLMGILWAPMVFRTGATRLGMAICLAHFAVLLGLSQSFRRVNPIASDLVKPSLAWVSFLAVFNYKLM